RFCREHTTLRMQHLTTRLTSVRLASMFLKGRANSGISTLSLHDARSDLQQGPLLGPLRGGQMAGHQVPGLFRGAQLGHLGLAARSEEHTSELQSRENLVCRLLLEKKTGSTAVDPSRRNIHNH